MSQEKKRLYEVSFITKLGQYPMMTHVLACTEAEAEQAVEEKHKAIRIVEVIAVR